MAGMWKKSLVYLGLAEEEDYDESHYAPEEEEQNRRAVIKRVPEPEAGRVRADRDSVVRPMPSAAGPRVHLVQPTAFNDAQEIGDKFRDGFSVLMNLQSADQELGRRLVDFASGLAYGLGGSMQPAAERVFLITPAGVQVSAEDRRRFLEERGFFNQA
ncbi:MAG: cell division protein SepF [Actinobacteria bacterium]|nr:cell division protein SepF [Actinomycetota bacterium]